MKPVFEDTHCPRCGDDNGVKDDEAVQMVVPCPNNTLGKTRLIWCAAGHIMVINGRGKVTNVINWE